MKIKDQLNALGTSDWYSLMLFALYKLFEVPEYSALSELAYTLDKNNLLRLLEVFGGLTLRIPTVEEMEDVTKMLLVYQMTVVDSYDFESALKELDCTSEELRRIRAGYSKLSDILSRYDFHVRGESC